MRIETDKESSSLEGLRKNLFPDFSETAPRRRLAKEIVLSKKKIE